MAEGMILRKTIIQESSTTQGEFEVRFIDYDGTILKTEYVDSGNAATPPDNPDRTAEGLTFVEWNNSYSNITHDLDVGATYETTDGKTHITVNLVAPLVDKDILLSLYKTDASELTVDWGDGNSNTFTNIGNFNTGLHTYSDYGEYIIKIWISSGTGKYSFGNGTSSTPLLNYNSQELNITKIYIGENVESILNYSFSQNYNLKNIVIPKTITTIGSYVFDDCWSLECAILPNVITTLNSYCFQDCHSLKHMCLPSSIVTIGINCFYNNYSLRKIILLENVTTISENCYRLCFAVDYIYLSNSVTTLNSYCFSYFYAIQEINFSSGITVLTDNILKYNKSLKEIKFEGNITSIEGYALNYLDVILVFDFTNCLSVPTLVSTTAFTNICKLAKIKVPSSLETAWKAATNWSTYADYIVGV